MPRLEPAAAVAHKRSQTSSGARPPSHTLARKCCETVCMRRHNNGACKQTRSTMSPTDRDDIGQHPRKFAAPCVLHITRTCTCSTTQANRPIATRRCQTPPGPIHVLAPNNSAERLGDLSRGRSNSTPCINAATHKPNPTADGNHLGHPGSALRPRPDPRF